MDVLKIKDDDDDDGGPNFRWPQVLTQRGPNYVFQFFSYDQKQIFLPKGAMAQWPPLNTPLLKPHYNTEHGVHCVISV